MIQVMHAPLCVLFRVSQPEAYDVGLSLTGDFSSDHQVKMLSFLHYIGTNFPFAISHLWGDAIGSLKYPVAHQTPAPKSSLH